MFKEFVKRADKIVKNFVFPIDDFDPSHTKRICLLSPMKEKCWVFPFNECELTDCYAQVVEGNDSIDIIAIGTFEGVSLAYLKMSFKTSPNSNFQMIEVKCEEGIYGNAHEKTLLEASDIFKTRVPRSCRCITVNSDGKASVEYYYEGNSFSETINTSTVSIKELNDLYPYDEGAVKRMVSESCQKASSGAALILK